MSKKNQKIKPEGEQDNSFINDFSEDSVDELDFDFESEKLDKKYDKDNESFDKKYRKKNKHKTEDRSTVEGVLDLSTSKEIYRLQMNGVFNQFFGIISTGKESNVYYATHKDSSDEDIQKHIAIKIYRTRTLDFKKIKLYIEGDIRFAKSGHKSHQIIQTWALKEYKNLSRAFEQGMQVPEPYFVKRNILGMQLIGDAGRAAPQLRQVRMVSHEEIQDIFDQFLTQLDLLWTKAKLVHGDLSAYNVLYWNKKIYFIDMGQAVLSNHMYADSFLLRDIQNILDYFSDYEIDLPSAEEIFEKLTSRIPDPELLKLKIT
jgi:RIO kinase 1